jgi:hypothetical protein
MAWWVQCSRRGSFRPMDARSLLSYHAANEGSRTRSATGERDPIYHACQDGLLLTQPIALNRKTLGDAKLFGPTITTWPNIGVVCCVYCRAWQP